jgi:subtilase family serine protease
MNDGPNLLQIGRDTRVRIGLAQQNLHRAEEFVNQVAHPASNDYGKHWSPKKIAETFAPSSETIYTVRTWLSQSGIDLSRVKMSQSGNWMTFNATAEEAERLLRTEYHLYKHESGHNHIARNTVFLRISQSTSTSLPRQCTLTKILVVPDRRKR